MPLTGPPTPSPASLHEHLAVTLTDRLPAHKMPARGSQQREWVSLHAVSFQQISRILDLTDALGINREWVKFLSPESPGIVRKLPNGNLRLSWMPTSRSMPGSAPWINRYDGYRPPDHVEGEIWTRRSLIRLPSRPHASLVRRVEG